METEVVAPYYSGPDIDLYHGDCGLVFPSIGQVDLIVTDPPWNLHGYSKRIEEAGQVGDESESEWFRQLWVWYASWIMPVLRTGAVKGWYFIGWYQIAPFLRIVTIIGVPIQHVFTKPGEEFLIYVGPNPIPIDRANQVEKYYRDCPYGNHKAVDLISNMISAILNQRSVVLDPFCGEGSTLIAARRLGHRAIGIEMREENCIKTKVILGGSK